MCFPNLGKHPIPRRWLRATIGAWTGPRGGGGGPGFTFVSCVSSASAVSIVLTGPLFRALRQSASRRVGVLHPDQAERRTAGGTRE